MLVIITCQSLYHASYCKWMHARALTPARTYACVRGPCACTCPCTHAQMDACANSHARACAHDRMCACDHAHMRSCACMRARRAFMLTSARACIHACSHVKKGFFGASVTALRRRGQTVFLFFSFFMRGAFRRQACP